MKFWEQITQEVRQGKSKASRWNLERERLRGIIMQVCWGAALYFFVVVMLWSGAV